MLHSTKEIKAKIFHQRDTEGFRIADMPQFFPPAPQLAVRFLKDILRIAPVLRQGISHAVKAGMEGEKLLLETFGVHHSHSSLFDVFHLLKFIEALPDVSLPASRLARPGEKSVSILFFISVVL
jgi:hypothetical protein